MNITHPWAVYCEGPPSFWGEGEGRRGMSKNEALLFQSTVDIHFQTRTNIISVYSWHTLSKREQNTKKLRRLAHSVRLFDYNNRSQLSE